jgi:hypothetical protein
MTNEVLTMIVKRISKLRALLIQGYTYSEDRDSRLECKLKRRLKQLLPLASLNI